MPRGLPPPLRAIAQVVSTIVVAALLGELLVANVQARRVERRRPRTTLDATRALSAATSGTVNDTRGHQYGDELLKQFAQALRAVARDGDCAARTAVVPQARAAEHDHEPA